MPMIDLPVRHYRFLPAEAPHQAAHFTQAQRTRQWIESSLGPTATTAGLLRAVAEPA